MATQKEYQHQWYLANRERILANRPNPEERRKPCKRCGGPKEAGHFRHLCNTCKTISSVRLCKHCGCTSLKKGYQYCDDCRVIVEKEWALGEPNRRAVYYQKHKQKIDARNAAWKEANPERSKALAVKRAAKRRARLSNVFVESVDPMVVYKINKGYCGICSELIEGEFHVDHVIPIARGGEHSYANVQLAHPKCNWRKGIK